MGVRPSKNVKRFLLYCMKKKPKKPKKLTKKKQLALARSAKRKALLTWSKNVRARDAKCIVCGRSDHLNAHHVLPKEAYKEWMFEEVNGVTLCPSHHKFNKYSAHKNPIWFAHFLQQFRTDQYEWAVEHMGED